MALESVSWKRTQKEEVKHPRRVYQELPVQNLAEKQWEDRELVYYWKLVLGHQLRDALAGR